MSHGAGNLPHRTIAALLAAALCLSSASAAVAGQRWALLVGVNDYAEIEDLAYCVRDMQSLRDQLVASGFPENQVFFLHDKADDAGNLPNRGNIEQQLRVILGLVDKDDLVVVAFSGHGMFLEGKSYLCPTEARPDRPAETMISVDTVYENMQQCPAALKLLLVDACRNDPRPAGQKSARAAAESSELARSLTSPPKGVLVLTSCAPGQLSWEDSGLQHGVFMNYVVEGLGGKADQNKNGSVSLLELYEFASLETKRFVARNRRQVQTPSLKGELEGVFEIGNARPSLGDPITNSIGMRLTPIPAGEFLMGGPESPEDLLRRFPTADRGDFDDEQPVHRVRIARSFYMGTHEVTLGQFLSFYHDAGHKTDAEKDSKGGTGVNLELGRTGNYYHNPGSQFRAWDWNFKGQTMDHPVVNVSWNDAVAFCQWLSRREGQRYRLPTEAEWEYACRAGTTTRYWNGDDPEEVTRVDNIADERLRSYAYSRNYIKWDAREFVQSNDGVVLTSVIGRFRANPFGLCDMHGNVREFCQDWYSQDYYRDSPEVDPQGPSTGTGRVIRGGCWFYAGPVARSANRSWQKPDESDCRTGFRVVRER